MKYQGNFTHIWLFFMVKLNPWRNVYNECSAWKKSTCLLHRGADKSLARPGRKRARKHVRDQRDFNNIDASCHQFLFSCKSRRRRKFTPFWQKHLLVSFLVGLRTYQHPCVRTKSFNYSTDFVFKARVCDAPTAGPQFVIYRTKRSNDFGLQEHQLSTCPNIDRLGSHNPVVYKLPNIELWCFAMLSPAV